MGHAVQDDGADPSDPRFKTNALRLKHRDQVVQAIEAWLAAGPSDPAAL
jgi:crotonobetainyl-CoA:carnitine CoA-transferase CaiB-like acyl-CoA transferase